MSRSTNKTPESDAWSALSYIQIAKDLSYPKSVIDKLKKAKNEIEAVNIMAGARHAEIDKDIKRGNKNGN